MEEEDAAATPDFTGVVVMGVVFDDDADTSIGVADDNFDDKAPDDNDDEVDDDDDDEEEAPLSAIFMPQTGSKFLSFQGSICRFSRSSSARRRVCISGVNSPSCSLSFHSTRALAKNSLFKAVALRRKEEGDVEEEEEEEEVGMVGWNESHSGRRRNSRC